MPQTDICRDWQKNSLEIRFLKQERSSQNSQCMILGIALAVIGFQDTRVRVP